MDNNNPTQMTDIELKKLETRVEDLLSTCSKLLNENKSLRHQQETLVSERAHLIEKNELARSRVESMITRLKSLESH
jgi:cell division protein ZapB